MLVVHPARVSGLVVVVVLDLLWCFHPLVYYDLPSSSRDRNTRLDRTIRSPEIPTYLSRPPRNRDRKNRRSPPRNRNPAEEDRVNSPRSNNEYIPRSQRRTRTQVEEESRDSLSHTESRNNNTRNRVRSPTLSPEDPLLSPRSPTSPRLPLFRSNLTEDDVGTTEDIPSTTNVFPPRRNRSIPDEQSDTTQPERPPPRIRIRENRTRTPFWDELSHPPLPPSLPFIRNNNNSRRRRNSHSYDIDRTPFSFFFGPDSDSGDEGELFMRIQADDIILNRVEQRHGGHGFFSHMNNGIGVYEQLVNLAPVPTPAKNKEKLPQINASEEHTKEICTICLSNYEVEEKIKVLPCSHIFHPACIDRWLDSKNKCPICKHDVD